MSVLSRVAVLVPLAVCGLAALAAAQSQSVKNTRGNGAAPAKQRPAKNIIAPSVSPAPNQNRLTLGETTFDPQVGVPMPPPGWDSSFDDPNGRNLRLVQFTGPIQEQWIQTLDSLGVEVIQYIYPHAYIVWSNNAELGAAGALPKVRWTGEFYPAYRVLPQWRNLNAQAIETDVLIYRGANVDAAVASIEQLGGQLLRRGVMDRTFEVAGIMIPGNMIKHAAKVSGVYTIQPVPIDGGSRGELAAQINANNIDGTNRAFPGYQSWLASVGVSGAGVIMANVDEGVRQQHPDLINRMLPCVGSTCATGQSSHGTHTAGIMAGDGASGVVDGNGFLRGLGVAPGANLIEQNYALVPYTPTGMLQLMQDSFNNGAIVSSNSWGPAGTPHGYDDDTRAVDVGVRDLDSVTPGDQSLTYVLAIMNGYGGTSSQGTPDEGKNLFTIGSTKGQNTNGAQILAVNDLSVNSGHGPCLDGRKIPHMVAPGCYIDSTVPNSAYSVQCGTSQACPAVAGAAALFIQYYRNLPNYTIDPSPAMIKAAFLPVCVDLSGNLDADNGVLGHPFDSKQGWGRMNLNNVVTQPAGTVLYYDNPAIFDSTGEQWAVDVVAADPNAPMRIMLVWTDAPGHGLGGSTPAWNNDLNLVVLADNTYLGNNFGANGYSTTGGTADIKNNTEGVFIQTPGVQTITLRVDAANINSDGLPNVGDTTDQDFAIVCYNCVIPINGACCVNDVCTITTSAHCVAQTGVWAGADTTCPGDCGAALCPADLVGTGGGAPDGMVDVSDLFTLLAAWNSNGPGADLAAPNDVVDVSDLFALLAAWGDCE